MEQTLQLWFLVLYTVGVVGFLSNVMCVRRSQPTFEKQIGPLPPVDALVAWLVPPLILLSGIGELSTERPMLRILGVGLSLYYIIMVSWTVRTLGRFLSGLAVYPDQCARHVWATSPGPSPSILGCLGALARGSIGYAELAPPCTLAAAPGRSVQ
jgi:hypothetical protein